MKPYTGYLHMTMHHDSLYAFPFSARRVAPVSEFISQEVHNAAPDATLPRVIDDGHELLKWLIPLPHKFTRNRCFTRRLLRNRQRQTR